jgi:hypothetical protein
MAWLRHRVHLSGQTICHSNDGNFGFLFSRLAFKPQRYEVSRLPDGFATKLLLALARKLSPMPDWIWNLWKKAQLEGTLHSLVRNFPAHHHRSMEKIHMFTTFKNKDRTLSITSGKISIIIGPHGPCSSSLVVWNAAHWARIHRAYLEWNFHDEFINWPEIPR